MRGKPVLQWCLFSVVWMLLVIPIAKVTFATSRVSESSEPEESISPVWVTLIFSTSPHRFSVGQDGEARWEESQPGGVELERPIPLHYDELGMEFDLAGDLPEGRAAVEVRVEPDGLPPASRTLWVEGGFEERVTFSWGRP